MQMSLPHRTHHLLNTNSTNKQELTRWWYRGTHNTLSLQYRNGFESHHLPLAPSALAAAVVVVAAKSVLIVASLEVAHLFELKGVVFVSSFWCDFDWLLASPRLPFPLAPHAPEHHCPWSPSPVEESGLCFHRCPSLHDRADVGSFYCVDDGDCFPFCSPSCWTWCCGWHVGLCQIAMPRFP